MQNAIELGPRDDGANDTDAPGSMGQILQANKGVGPGFDFLRVMLAASIVFAHSYQITSGAIETTIGQPLWMPVYLQVPMFFTLSGFLIAGSAARLSLGNFLLNCAFRIYPALIAEIVLSIFIIGLLFTKVGLFDFFSSTKFFLYLTNLLGLPHYTLPGVFEHNPLRYIVNGSLWTVPYELACYLIMSLLIVSGIIRSKKRLLFFVAAVIDFAIGPQIFYNILGISALQNHDGATAYLVSIFMNPSNTMLFAYFSCGVAAYQFRGQIPYSGRIATVCVGALFALTLIGDHHNKEAWFRLLALPIGVYLTLFIGLTPLRLPGFLRSGDYSYGIYLYGFPVQQAVQSVTGAGSSMWLNFAIAAPIVFLWSRFSWRFVERPALAMRKRIASGRSDGVAAAQKTAASDGSPLGWLGLQKPKSPPPIATPVATR